MAKKPSANRANHAKTSVTATGARKRKSSGRVTPKGTRPSGRVTPKGTRPSGRARPAGKPAVASSRYTPPTARASKLTPWWVPYAFFGLLAIGMLGVFLNYLSVLPGAPSWWWLTASLAAIFGSIISATQFR